MSPSSLDCSPGRPPCRAALQQALKAPVGSTRCARGWLIRSSSHGSPRPWNPPCLRSGTLPTLLHCSRLGAKRFSPQLQPWHASGSGYLIPGLCKVQQLWDDQQNQPWKLEASVLVMLQI